jgi:hypothetical protein
MQTLNSITAAELLTAAAALFPDKLRTDSKPEQLDALQKTMHLLELAREFVENPDAEIYRQAAESDDILPYNYIIPKF